MYKYLFLAFIFLIGCQRDENNPISNDDLPPSVPVGLKVQYSADGEIVIEWNDNSENDIKYYNVFRSINNSEYIKIDFVERSRFFEDSLNYNDTISYRISAVDNSNNESNLSNPVFTIPTNQYKPLKPAFLQIYAHNWINDKFIELSWYSYDTDIKQYNIYRSYEANFTPDSLTFVGSSTITSFNDSIDLVTDTQYFYKIISIDKGDVPGEPSDVINDIILDIPQIIAPVDNFTFNGYDVKFVFISNQTPSTYKLVLQSNQFFDEIWSTTFEVNKSNDTVEVPLNYSYIERGKNYYWRIITYSKDNEHPNSISPLFTFKINR